MPELIFEIGCEELPADALAQATQGLARAAAERLKHARIPHEGLEAWSTPRRLTLIVRNLAAEQQVSEERITGPAWKAAFDAEGKATRAATGFAAKQGVEVSALVKVVTEKGEYVGIEKKLEAEKTADQLPRILQELIRAVPFPKSMRWGNQDESFGRPVHWMVALFDGRVVDVTFTGIRSGNETRGHRFLAPEPFAVKGIEDYVEGLRKAHVLVNPAERRERTLEGLRKAAAEKGGELLLDEDLLDEVVNLVEWPVPLAGTIEERFLEIPREVIITSMKDHQRYFSLLKPDGSLLPNFITVSNMIVKDEAGVVAGNQRVLAARLSDAMFFVREDVKRPLIERLDDLKKVVFQAKLGTIHEKVERFTALAVMLNDRAHVVDEADLKRAAHLAKADLTTGMVGEFPELQGVIGAEYAERQGEKPEVAKAVFEHYLPRGADDALPTGDIGALVAMADKLDTIVGCFGVGLIPSGTADPYALRRAALGILNILLDKKYPLGLAGMVDEALALLQSKLTRDREEVRGDVLHFLRGRYENLLRTQGMAPDEVDAVLARGFDDVVDARARIEALHGFRGQPAFASLAAAFKRTANILAKELGTAEAGEVNSHLFQEDAERSLFGRIEALSEQVGRYLAEKRYEDALRVVSGLQEPVDGFFNDVLVVAEDAQVKANRLALLARLRGLFDSFADFTKLGGSAAQAGV